jgi:hypothetical protein
MLGAEYTALPSEFDFAYIPFLTCFVLNLVTVGMARTGFKFDLVLIHLEYLAVMPKDDCIIFPVT